MKTLKPQISRHTANMSLQEHPEERSAALKSRNTPHKISETLLVSALLAVTGGLLDA